MARSSRTHSISVWLFLVAWMAFGSGLEAQTGEITGQVTGPGSAPVPGIEVSLYQRVEGAWTYRIFEDTSTDGTYSFSGLEDGEYTLLFRDWSQNLAYEYFDNASRLADATPIVVMAGSVVPVDAALEPGGRIAGSLTDPGGRPLDYPLIFAYTAESDPEILFLTNPDPTSGEYEIGGLPSGDYLIQFTGRQGLDNFFGYFDGVEVIEDATPIPVMIGETTDNIDGTLGLPPGGLIEGRITDPYGRAFDFARVLAFVEDGGEWVLAGETETAFYSSDYRLPLAPGLYRLWFEAGSFLQPDLPAGEFFDDVLDLADATEVEVVLGETRSSFDVVVGNLSLGSISGTVSDADTGAPLAGIEIYPADRGGQILWDQVAVTDAAGEYTVEGLWPEGYFLELYDPSFTYETRRLPERVLVGEGAVTGIDASLALAPAGSLPGSISGRVTGTGGEPLSNIRVSADSGLDSGGGWAVTDSDGRYRIRGLAADSYQLRFSAPDGFRVTEWYDDAADRDGAVPVAVGNGVDSGGIDAELAPAGVITGVITNLFGGDFFLSTATAYTADGDGWAEVGTAFGVFESEYRLEGIPAGSVRILFTGRAYTGPAEIEVYDNVATLDEGTDVVVAGGLVTSGISAVLGAPPSGAITGRVTDGAGTDLEGIAIRVFNDDFELEAEAATGADGRYEVSGLYNGRYYVEMVDPEGIYPAEVFDDVTSLELGTPVVVVDGDTTAGIDAALDGADQGPGGGGFRGTVTDTSSGAPVSGIRVECLDELFSFVSGCSTFTDAAGSYQLAGFLPAGLYYLSFRSPDGAWADEWYDDVIRLADATPVAASLGAWTDGIDAALEPAGGIRGTVTDRVGNAFPLLTATAYAWNGSEWEPYKGFFTAYDTEYEILGLPAGAYRVRFQGSPLTHPDAGIVEFYDDVATVDLGTDVPVVVGQTTEGIDAVLDSEPGGRITGAVSDGSGNGLEGIEVRVFDDELHLAGQATTAADGSYRVEGLFNGRYSVDFRDPSGTFPSEAFDDVPSLDLATPVQVANGGTTTGIDAALDGSGSGPGGGGVRGTLTDASTGAPLPGIRVRCFDEFFGSVAGCDTVSGADGSYQLAGFLPAGDYLVGFRSADGFFVDEWYDDVPRLDQATPVAVSLGAWTEGIDAELEPAGRVRGSVTNESGGAFPLLTVTAFVRNGADWEPFKGSLTAFDTEYEILGLPAGDVRVRFRGSSLTNPSGGIVEFYDDVASVDLGTDVSVVAGQVTTGIDAVLGNVEGTASALVDPGFDHGLEAWAATLPEGSELLLGEVDLAGSSSSGSAEIRHRSGSEQRVSLSQCVAVRGEERFRFGGWLRVEGAAAMSSAPLGWVQVELFSGSGCSGEPLAQAGTPALAGERGWSRLKAEVDTPAAAVSARVSYLLDSAAATGFDAFWDDLFFEERFLIFADGFESGTLSGWSSALQ